MPTLTEQIVNEQVAAFRKGDRMELEGRWYLVMESKSQGLFRRLALMPTGGEERGSRVDKVISGKKVVPMLPSYAVIERHPEAEKIEADAKLAEMENRAAEQGSPTPLLSALMGRLMR